MRRKLFIAILALSFFAADEKIASAPSPHMPTPAQGQDDGPLAMPQNVPPDEQAPQQSGQSIPTLAPPSAAPIKTNTRLITIDVVASDSHGQPVRGLKQNDFQVIEEHHGEQKIAKFEFIDASASAAAAGIRNSTPPGEAHIYSNQPFDRTAAPPTVLLMDALNTQAQNQTEVRRHMVMLLKTLPANTAIAIFLLGHELHVVQNFTTDPAQLRAAVDKANRPLPTDQNPQDDANSPSNVILDNPDPILVADGNEESITQAMEGFEKEEYAAQMTVRVDETAKAMESIATYLAGYPGRKNLVWFSEAFPIAILPNADFGNDSSMGTANYGDTIQAAARALTDARVAVYPVDAGGLTASILYSTAQNPHMSQGNPGGGFGAQISREDATRVQTQGTMDEIAQDSGGRTCTNTNDLSGCVQTALTDGSSYYELAYYPQDAKWDGRFQKITVKTKQHDVKLEYRRGYFATDTSSSAQQPEKLLSQACGSPLPSGGIALTAQAVPPKQTPGQPPQDRYMLTILPGALTITPQGKYQQMNVQMAICEYGANGDSFHVYPRDLSQTVPEAAYQDWQHNGIRDVFDFQAPADTRRLRFVVLDVPSGATGSLDVPAHPQDFANASSGAPVDASSRPSLAPTPATPPATSPATPEPPAPLMTGLSFRVADGRSSALDWSGDKLWYHGDLGIPTGASSFFDNTYAATFRCQDGALVPIDPSGGAVPHMLLTFRNSAGHAALVDLGGSEPVYSGDLTVDASARAFFEYFWKLAHCQTP